MELDVSIIYVNYFTSHLIIDSIKSVIEKTKDITYEIIIVDNNTERDLEAKLDGILPGNIPFKCIYLKDNIGFGPANNEGAKVAQGRNLFLFNPDTLLINNAIKILNDFLLNHPKVGACGGNLTDAQNNPSISHSKIFPGVNWDFQELTNNLFTYPLHPIKRIYNFKDHPVKVAYITGADLMIRKDIYEKCKGFPEDIFMYWEDVEICKRVKDLGYEIYNVPEARICHLESRSFENKDLKKSWKIELLEKYRFVYLRRNLNKFSYNLSNILYHAFLFSRTKLTQGKKQEFYNARLYFYHKYRKPSE